MPKKRGDPKGVSAVTRAHQLAIAERRERITSLVLRRVSQKDIASQIGVSQGTVSKDITAVEREIACRRQANAEEIRARKLAELAEIKAEAWRGWENSLRDGRKTQKGVLGAGVVDTSATEQRDGDPRFLKEVRECISEECDLLGVRIDPEENQNGKGGAKLDLGALMAGAPKEVTVGLKYLTIQLLRGEQPALPTAVRS
jgi:DNA-binding MarR family transcriptional regulator